MQIISGGQTGADIGALRAAKEYGVKTGGWIPKGFLTEDGPKPDRAQYGLKETDTSDYVLRTHMNVLECNVTIWFGNPDSRGGKATKRECRFCNKPFMLASKLTDGEIAFILCTYGNNVINVAGNRESHAPGIENCVYERMLRAFKLADLIGGWRT